MATNVDDKLDLILAETRAVAAAQDSQGRMLGLVLACLEAVPPRLDTHTEILRRLLEAATEDGGGELSALLARFERLLSDQLAEIRAMRQQLGVLPDQVEVAVQDGLHAMRPAEPDTAG